jgi:hypothetical protein
MNRLVERSPCGVETLCEHVDRHAVQGDRNENLALVRRQLVRDRLLKLPKQLAALSAQLRGRNVERLRVAHEEFLAGKSEFGAEFLDPEVEWDASEAPIPDIAEVYRGIEGVRRFWREWLAAWETVQFEYELIDAGDSVVALIDQRMRGRSTGIEVPMGKYAQVYTFRDSLLVNCKFYTSQLDALEAAGLRK